MRKTLITSLSVLATLGMVSTAQAHSSDFGGFYIGLHAGETVWDTDWTERDNWADEFGQDFELSTVANKLGKVNWGAQAGWNFRCTHSLFGIEIDWSSVNATQTKTYTAVPAFDGPVLSLSNDLDWYGSIRGRAGIIADNLLLFVTGGVAFADFEHDWFIYAPANGITFEQSGIDDTRWGGVAGVGAELAVLGCFSIKVEGLYYTFAEKTNSFFSNEANQTVFFDVRDSFVVGRIGVNYHF